MTQNLRMYTREYYLNPKKPEGVFGLAEQMRPDQASALCYCFSGGYTPKCVLSVGCGLGLLERLLHRLGVAVIATDPAPGLAAEKFPFPFHPVGLKGAITFLPKVDTVVFCESIEHIPKRNIVAFIRQMRGRLIITNWLSHHPIAQNSQDHITPINDRFFDWLCRFGTVVFRHRSHLVLDCAGGKSA